MSVLAIGANNQNGAVGCVVNVIVRLALIVEARPVALWWAGNEFHLTLLGCYYLLFGNNELVIQE